MNRFNVGAEREVEGWACYDISFPEGQWNHWDIRVPESGPTGPFDYGVCHHVLSMLDHHELVPALRNIHAILKPGGVLRISDMDIERGVNAWQQHNSAWFPQDQRIGDMDDRFCTWVTWFGTRKSVFTRLYMAHLLRDAGFLPVPCLPGISTSLANQSGICELDRRNVEDFYIEGVKQ